MAPAVPHDVPPHVTRGMLDLEAEVDYWRGYYARATPALRFDAYEQAVRLGIQACLHAHGRSFEDMGAELGEYYERARSRSALEWNYAMAVAKASWLRIEQARPGPAPDASGPAETSRRARPAAGPGVHRGAT